MKITKIMLAKGFGGAERSFVDTALALAARGHQVQAICNPNFIKKHLLEGVAGVQVAPVNARGTADFFAPRKIAKLMRGFGTEVVHTQLKRAAWHGGRAASKTGIPVVAKTHNYVDVDRYRYVHTLVCTTEEQRDHVLKQGWSAERAVVIPNFSRVPPVAVARIPEGNPLQLLAYGRYSRNKGFDVLLQALHAIVEQGVDARLTLGGSGPEAEALVALAASLGVADKVEIGVWIDNVTSALDEADVFVLPSRDEPFGIVMLEAMARGLPMVTTRTQGPRQVLTDDSTYFAEIDSVESLARALLELAGDRALAGAKAAAALQLYRSTYHEDAVLPRLEELYKAVSAA